MARPRDILLLKIKVKATKEVVWAKSDKAFGVVSEDGRYFSRTQYVVLDRKIKQNEEAKK